MGHKGHLRVCDIILNIYKIYYNIQRDDGLRREIWDVLSDVMCSLLNHSEKYKRYTVMLCAHFLNYSEKYEWYKVMLCTRRSTFREIWEVQSDIMCSLLELFREIWEVQSDLTYSQFRELREVQNDVMCSPQFGRGLHILLQPFRAGIFLSISILKF